MNKQRHRIHKNPIGKMCNLYPETTTKNLCTKFRHSKKKLNIFRNLFVQQHHHILPGCSKVSP